MTKRFDGVEINAAYRQKYTRIYRIDRSSNGSLSQQLFLAIGETVFCECKVTAFSSPTQYSLLGIFLFLIRFICIQTSKPIKRKTLFHNKKTEIYNNPFSKKTNSLVFSCIKSVFISIYPGLSAQDLRSEWE